MKRNEKKIENRIRNYFYFFIPIRILNYLLILAQRLQNHTKLNCIILKRKKKKFVQVIT